MKDLFGIKSKRIITPEGIVEGTILILNGKISEIISPGNEPEVPVTDYGNLVIMPGVIDSHVHINEPGRTEWEGFETATRAAAAGGVTTLIEMPLNSSPVTTNFENFKLKLRAAAGKTHVNCGFWGGVVPDNGSDLEKLLENGAFGLKAFLTHSGIDDFPNSNADHLRNALTILKRFNKPLLVHCEISEPLPDNHPLHLHPRSYQAYLSSRPRSWENNAIELMISLCRETGARVHIVHLSSADALPAIRRARAEGLPLTVETTQHYLTFNSENIKDGDTIYKCAPPIRESENNQKLWEALKEGVIDFIVTDHSPAPPDIKEIESGDFMAAWGGIAGLQFSLSSIWTGAKEKGISLMDISRWLSANVASFTGLSTKGRIDKGYDADLVVWDPEKKFMADPSIIHHRHKITPYAGKEWYGVVECTYLKGKKVFEKGNFLNLNQGEILLKK